jgi:hypothetical protein
MRSGDMVAAFEIENKPRSNRNSRYSFNLRRLRETLVESDRTWARDHLGLDIPRNPQMVPFLADRRAFERKAFFPVLHQLRMANSHTPRRLNGFGYLEQEAYVTARMIEWAQIVGDDKRLHRAMARVRYLRRFVEEDGLARKINQEGEIVPGKLVDYLAFADAMLQAYLASGSIEDERAGSRALAQAESMFRGSSPGLYRLSLDLSHLPVEESPEIEDNLRASASSQLIRLLTCYGRIEGRRDWQIGAREIVGRFAAIAEAAGPEVAGYFSASTQHLDDLYAVAVGPHALQQARALRRLRPLRFVGLGSVRPDLAPLQPGIYLVSSKVAGPFSVDGAALLLPATLRTP